MDGHKAGHDDAGGVSAVFLSHGYPMNPREALWLAHQRRRWMLPDPSRWLEPDQRKWQWPESPRHAQSEPHERKYTNVALHAENLARLGRSIAAMRRELACVQAELLRRKAGFNPNQPRWPIGTPDGGKWSGGSGGNQTSASENLGRNDYVILAQFDGRITDPEGRPYYGPGGHHEMPVAVYSKWNLSPETLKIFQQSSTGTISPNTTFRETPEGPRLGNIWNNLHLTYNRAVEELSNSFMKANKLKPDGSDMTADQARALLKEIRLSEDPRIRDFNLNTRRIQRLLRLRGGDDD